MWRFKEKNKVGNFRKVLSGGLWCGKCPRDRSGLSEAFGGTGLGKTEREWPHLIMDTFKCVL